MNALSCYRMLRRGKHDRGAHVAIYLSDGHKTGSYFGKLLHASPGAWRLTRGCTTLATESITLAPEQVLALAS